MVLVAERRKEIATPGNTGNIQKQKFRCGERFGNSSAVRERQLGRSNMERDETYSLIKSLWDFDIACQKSEIFPKADFVRVLELITPIVRPLPIQFSNLEIVRTRSVPGSTDLENVRQMGYPPEPKARRARCNHEGQQLLYGSSDLPTSFLEAGFSESEPCAMSAMFKLKEGENLTLISIGEIDHNRRYRKPRLGTPGIAEQIAQLVEPLDAFSRIALYYVDAYLADFFSRENSASEPFLYDITAELAGAFMHSQEIDGLIYPSVMHAGGINFVFKPQVFDERFELVKFTLSTPVDHLGYGLFAFFESANGNRIDEKGNFMWVRDPRFNARGTIPLSAEWPNDANAV